jgi:FPC/CPF motif-containing protein YcgG
VVLPVDREQLAGEPQAESARGNFCRVTGGILTRPYDAEPPSALTTLVHEAFRGLALNERFSCVAGRAAIRRDAYRFGLYDRLGSAASAADLACDLTRFAGDDDLRAEPLTTFVASFVEPVPADEAEFESLLWATLQHLNDTDVAPWTDDARPEPEDPAFSFSFNGVGFFIVGLHARSSRFARRFAWSTLVFNPHAQFDRLRQEGRYSRYRDVIRARDLNLQGTANPMLSDFGEESEARQYSGRAVGEAWKCPFHARRAAREDE